VRLEVVHLHQRHPGLSGERRGLPAADPQAQRQPGPRRDGDGVDVADPQPGLGQRALHRAVDGALVRGGRQLGHNAAEGRVQLGLRGQRPAEHAAVAADDGGARVVAGRFDPEDDAARVPPRGGPEGKLLVTGAGRRRSGSSSSSSSGAAAEADVEEWRERG